MGGVGLCKCDTSAFATDSNKQIETPVPDTTIKPIAHEHAVQSRPPARPSPVTMNSKKDIQAAFNGYYARNKLIPEKQQEGVKANLPSKVIQKLNELGEYKFSKFSDPHPREFKAPTKLKNGDIYEGEWSENVPHGNGTLYKVDGSLLSCGFIMGNAIGEGRLIESNGTFYIGEFLNEEKHGKGVENEDGIIYDGEFENNEKTGSGTETVRNETKFTGTFISGKKQGKGKLEHLLNGSIYEGIFTDNMISGFGTYTWPDGRNYTGQWLNDQMHGEGKFIWPDGRYYDGSYQHDKKEGQGTFVWANAKEYEGNWFNNRQDGIGYLTDPNKDDVVHKKGIWEDGRFVRWIS